MPERKRRRMVQTTLRLPRPLYERSKRALAEGRATAGSINMLVIDALIAYLKNLRRAEVDAAFAGMADDALYQKEALQIEREFGKSDWEALGKAERSTRRRRASR